MHAPVAGPVTMGRLQWAASTQMKEPAGTAATVMAIAVEQLNTGTSTVSSCGLLHTRTPHQLTAADFCTHGLRISKQLRSFARRDSATVK